MSSLILAPCCDPKVIEKTDGRLDLRLDGQRKVWRSGQLAHLLILCSLADGESADRTLDL